MNTTNATVKGRNISKNGEFVRNVKFYYQDRSTVESLDRFHSRAISQVKTGVSRPNNNFDAHLLD